MSFVCQTSSLYPVPAMSFAAACAPPLSIGAPRSPLRRRTTRRLLPLQCAALLQSPGEPGPSVREQAAEETNSGRGWRVSATAALATVVIGFGGLAALPAGADLNKYEADVRGEFGIGSAAQFGSADLKKAVHTNENFRRANFTSADMRESDFSGSTFNGAYLEKAVAYKANFTGADLSDTLMDRMVLNEANLTNAVLVRSVLTRSDLGGAIIEGADFSDAVIDLTQKQLKPILHSRSYVRLYASMLTAQIPQQG